MSQYKNIISEIIVTCFFVGRIKFAPGTMGSLLAFPLIYSINAFIIRNNILLNIEGYNYLEQRFITIFVSLFFIIAILFLIGLWASNIYIKSKATEDPQEIVIDELVGQMLTSSLTMISVVFVYNAKLNQIYNSLVIDLTCFVLLPFILFRICDIIKPWPIKWLDKNIPGGWGVMIDDVAAAFMAAILQYAIIFIIIN